jgi:RHS repeat-associated protein
MIPPSTSKLGQNNSSDAKADTRSKGSNGESFAVSAPSVTLPKGGGAIHGMGEKFAANPVTGTGSVSVPIAVSPGRAGFGPQLSLTYDSGSGNGPFGFGWSLALPSITRKTNQGIPKYRDAEESDVFVVSGAEDLVPVLNHEGTRHQDKAIDPNYTIHRYRPRIEGLFARIERWTRNSDGDVHWRSISKDNVLTLYGKDAASRIANPETPQRIFSWLVCETRDTRGNAIIYDYKAEDGLGVHLDRACERNRGERNDPRRTANRYLKSIRYGNRTSLLNSAGARSNFLTDLQIENGEWMFEVVFDYGEHDSHVPTPHDAGAWIFRDDPFSSHRSGFEVRTTRLCRRVLMFHHFAEESGVGQDCLVRSTDFSYSHQKSSGSENSPIYTFLQSATQTAYQRDEVGYRKRSMPPVEFEYSQAVVQEIVEDVDPASLENLPIGVDGATYRWTDLHGEGIPGILTEQADAWFYKRNISPISQQQVELAPLELVATKPNLMLAGGGQFMDLAGDGELDLVLLDGPNPGFFEHDSAEGWQPFRSFSSRLNRNMGDPNLKFLDLDGDGHADVMITEGDTIVWHASLAEEGFGPAQRVDLSFDEETGPRLVFADGTQSIYLADFCGDGLTDIVRIRNGEVCYWPNLGYGRFGAKVAMDNPPLFDHPDQFEQTRILLADIDGSGTTDILYLHRDGVRLYFNQSGNSWSEPRQLNVFPRVDDRVSIVTADLLGNGTACLVWSSSLPDDAGRPMRYVNLMGSQKPHLLIRSINNLGAETQVTYAPSTKFYLQDKYAGKPWITRLPFPVHVVERVETFDHISRNRFATRYAYHHGYFDGHEREFRGFGMVEQWDTEKLGSLTADGLLPASTNHELASHVPPVLTKTWFHTGVFIDRQRISNFSSGVDGVQQSGEYYREPGMTDEEYRASLLADTMLPPSLTAEEEREACRSLKGSVLRQEVYALDGTDKERHPYSVAESNQTVKCLQRQGDNRHAVFFAYAREAITYHYERNPADPRIQHAITLEVDDFGQMLKQLAIGYGRRQPDLKLPTQFDRDKQTQVYVTYSESRLTNPIDHATFQTSDYLSPLGCESKSYELTGFVPENNAVRFSFDEWTRNEFSWLSTAAEIPYEQQPNHSSRQKRLIEHVRSVYRANDLTAMLPIGQLESRAIAGESYKLAFTPGLLSKVFQREGQSLLPDPPAVLGSGGNDRGGYLPSQKLKGDGIFPASDMDNHWWIPSGRAFFSAGTNDSPQQELKFAQEHFFQPLRFRTPFHSAENSTESVVAYDKYDLMVIDSMDAIGNRVTVGERKTDGSIDPDKPGVDYRVLQPRCIMDPNRNRSQVAFDVLGMVVGSAVLGKPEENLGDSLEGFVPELTELEMLNHLANPFDNPHSILGRATSRIVYDLFSYHRSKDSPDPQPSVVYAITRETHDADLQPDQQTKVQYGFSYSDGFGREIQKKVQAEPGKVIDDGPVVQSRWVATGWTIFNNKGKPVRQYEPFFTSTHGFEFGNEVGVSPVLFYDPTQRVVATLMPNNTYAKVIFDPWEQTSWDPNDTVLSDPRTDADIKGFTASYFANKAAESTWQTWHAQRIQGTLGPEEQVAASKAAAHAGTPSTAYFDSLGRSFLTLVDNGPDPENLGQHQLFASRVELDIEGNQCLVRDAIVQAGDPLGRMVMRYSYDLLGNRIHQISMEAGSRWMLGDIAGNPIRAWNSRGFVSRTEFDRLRRPIRSFVIGTDSTQLNREILTDRMIPGDQHPNAEALNMLGQVFLKCDQAGVFTTGQCDFKGNPVQSSRRIAREYKQSIEWASVDIAVPTDAAALIDLNALEAAIVPLVEPEIYTSSLRLDALNRPITSTSPDGSVFRPRFNEANLLDRVDVNLRGVAVNGELVWTPFVTNIDYDAKGQRERIDYGNGVRTTYKYDPLTYRLTQLLTRRDPANFPNDCPQPAPAGWPGCQLQNLHYTYDPVGNITRIRDDAQQTIFFRNKRVEPTADYTYDAIYRLIEATGREHLGQINGAPIPHSPNDAPRSGRLWSENDGQAMGTYVENYLYDPVGNFLEMRHRGSSPVHAGWTRSYAYHEASLIEDGTNSTLAKTSNRLSHTVVAGVAPVTESYVHDAHGNMTYMPHLGGSHPTANMHWDHRDQLCRVALPGGGGTAYYTYDASGQRTRKVIEKSANHIEERFYLGGFEIYRRQRGAERLERETLHVMVDTQRVAMIETRTVDTAGDDQAPHQLMRYQLSDHLGSTSLEVDDRAGIISYEQFTPYGTTSYSAVRGQIELAKRYRYSGMERDEETGLSYHSARYLATWFAKWVSCDPIMLKDGNNLFCYSACSPICFTDTSGQNKKKASVGEGSVLHVADKTLDQKGIPFNTEVKLRILTRDDNGNPIYVTRTYDRVYFEKTGKLKAIEAKGKALTKQEYIDQSIADSYVQKYGGTAQVITPAGKPPKTHGSGKRNDLPLDKKKVYEIEPGNVEVIHGQGSPNASNKLKSNSLHIEDWREVKNNLPDKAVAPDLARYTAPNMSPTYLTQDQVKAQTPSKKSVLPGNDLPKTPPKGAPYTTFDGPDFDAIEKRAGRRVFRSIARGLFIIGALIAIPDIAEAAESGQTEHAGLMALGTVFDPVDWLLTFNDVAMTVGIANERQKDENARRERLELAPLVPRVWRENTPPPPSLFKK